VQKYRFRSVEKRLTVILLSKKKRPESRSSDRSSKNRSVLSNLKVLTFNNMCCVWLFGFEAGYEYRYYSIIILKTLP